MTTSHAPVRRAHRRRTTTAAVTLVVLALALVAAACGGGDDDAGSGDGGQDGATTTTADPGPPQPGGKIAYGLSVETDGWDPSTSRWAPSGLVVANSIFDTLSRFTEDGEIEPYLAESFTPNDDYTEWTIKLRPDVTFHNGQPLNAAAVVKNLEFHLQSQLTGPIFQEVESVTEVDDLTVRVAIENPWWNLPVALSTQIGVVAAPEMLDAPAEDRARRPIGTGPFMFEEWKPDSFLRVVRNPNYWQTDEDGNQLPYLDEIEFRPIVDPTTRAASLEAGDIDMAQMSEPIELSRFEEGSARGNFNLYVDETSEQDEIFVMLNTAQPPFDEEIARQALAYGTDVDLVVETQAEGLWAAAEGPFRESSRWHTDVDYPAYDQAKATELVQEYEDEFGPLEFELVSNPSPYSLQITQFLAQQWEQIGITVTLNSIETSQLIAQNITGNYQATLWQQFGSAHPLLETPWWHCDFVAEDNQIGLNFARNCDRELSDALDQARFDDDPDNQKDYYDTVQERIAADIPYIWLMHTEVSIVAREGIHSVFDYTLPSGSPGLPINNGAHPLQQVWISE